MIIRRSSLLGLLLVALLAGPAVAQETPAPPADPPAETTAEDASEVSTADGPVEVDKETPDTRITKRIREILTATERFENLDVQVRDGVAFLRGRARTEAMRKLAGDLARRTEGVAAVVNDITIVEEPVWTFAPARTELDKLLREGVRTLPLLVVGLILLTIFVLLAGVTGRLAGRVVARGTDSELLQNVLRKAVVLVVVVFGVYLALRLTGLTRVAIAVVSGTGLVGLALGFAFRDIAENFLASILLSIQRPFRLGDVISVDGHTGVVRKVTSRGTLLIDFDGNHIQIANATVYKNTIKNFSANPTVRINFVIGIGYDDEITRAQQVAREVLDGHPAVLNDPEPLVLVDELGASTINLRIYFWINSVEHSMLKMKSSVIRLTLRALAAAGVSMPDESREVIFPQGVPVRMLDQQPASPPSATPAPQPVRHDEAAEVAVDAEGDLTSETFDLNRQAAAARDPEQGENVLDGDGA